ncbi:MAG: response regulator [Candidatus Thiodiazotropha sp. (ex Codakia rugifera)]|nr:response regulator [Candidatus Thiodiazotropha sp. (ex Codakia rugifera)]
MRIRNHSRIIHDKKSYFLNKSDDCWLSGCSESFLCGIEFTRRYRRIEPKHRYMSIYALTANSVEDMLDHCIKAGMDGFLTKPVEPEILDEIIGRCINTLGQSDLEQPLTVPG